MSTIEDVARVAGVSTATVSRFLNNPGLVAKSTAERVRAAIQTLRYVPNALAGSLASNSSEQIAITVPHLVHSIVDKTVEQLVERLSRAGKVPFLGITGLDEARTNEVLLSAASRRVSAIITTGPVVEPARSMLVSMGITVIEMWGLPTDPVDVAIGFSHLEVGRSLARFAYESGYRRPHLVTAAGHRAERRKQGFIERWTGLSRNVPTHDTVQIPTHYGHGKQVVAHLEHLPQQPDLIITGSDDLAIGVIVQLHRAGVKVPGDVGVIGFGDLDIAAMVEPTITTVRIDGNRIADRVLEVIEARRLKQDLPTNRIDCGFEIVVRESA